MLLQEPGEGLTSELAALVGVEYLGFALPGREALALYKEAEDNTPDLRGKAMFKSLAREEEEHLTLLEEELEWINKSRKYFTLHRFALRAR